MSLPAEPDLALTGTRLLSRETARAVAGVKLGYFGHDVADAAIRRRVAAFRSDGIDVTGFMPHRRKVDDLGWDNVDLGETRDGAFRERIGAIVSGAKIAAEDPRLRQMDVLVARNLDMLICAFEARRRAGLKMPVVYECLDVHRLLCRKDPVGIALRAVERRLLKASAGLIVSSPGFVENHFIPRHGQKQKVFLVENRLAAGMAFGPRPALEPVAGDGPISVGWIGNLRCQRSFELLLGLADTLGDRLHIHLHGAPSRLEIPCFEPRIDARENVTFHGRYTAPDDLDGIYAGLDLVWAGDFMEAGYNSVWLLPNRLYEGGYYGVPSIAPAGTQTAKWISDRQAGFVIPEPLERSLGDLAERLIYDRRPARAARANLLMRPRSDFVSSEGEMAVIIAEVLGLGDQT